jgi:phosphate/phosphite/phosphonate ABC transporter binding protein
MMRISSALCAALLLAGPALGADKPAAAPECDCGKGLKVGAVAYSPQSVNVFRSLRHYAGKNGMPLEFVLYSDYDSLNDALAKGQVDLAWNSPLGHAKFHKAAGGSQAVVMRDVDRDYRVQLIVRKDAGVSSPADLAGKTMVFGSCDSADCTVLPVFFLKKEGARFDKVKILSLHKEVDAKGVPCHSAQHVWQALLAGRGQAGILGVGMWKRLQAEHPEQAGRFKAVWTSPPFSHCVFTARKDFDKATAEKFAKLMRDMDAKDPAAAEVLKLEHCARWVPAGARAQEGYRDLLEALRVQPALPVTFRGEK